VNGEGELYVPSSIVVVVGVVVAVVVVILAVLVAVTAVLAVLLVLQKPHASEQRSVTNLNVVELNDDDD